MRMTMTNQAPWRGANRSTWQQLLACAVAPTALVTAAIYSHSREALVQFQITKLEVLPAGGVEFRTTGPTGAIHSLQVSRDLIHWRTIDFQNTETGETVF